MVTHAYARQLGMLMDYLVIGSLPPTQLSPKEQKEWDELQADPAKLRERRKQAHAKFAVTKEKRRAANDLHDAKDYCADPALQRLLTFVPSPRTTKERALSGQITSLQAQVRMALQAEDWREGRACGTRLAAAVSEYTDLENRNARRLAVSCQTTDQYKTLRAAYADGWKDLHAGEYGGDRIMVKGHTLVKNPQRALSETQWKKLGFEVKPGEQPYATLHTHCGTSVWYGVYREDQVRPVNWRDVQEALDILKKME